MRAELRASRTLLFPGPLAPLSHFGITLLRHSVATSLRYTLYQLGLEPPDAPPLAIVKLRPYFDAPALADHLGDSDAARSLTGALLDPGGVAASRRLPARLAGAARFHRLRLGIPYLHHRGARRSVVPDPSAAPQALWHHFRATLSRELAALGEALLGEVVVALARRRRRAAGDVVGAVRGSEAHRFATGGKVRLEALGPPDALKPSWARDPSLVTTARHRSFEEADHSRLRGAFRERYRQALELIDPAYRLLARTAVERGGLKSVDEAYFLPFELAADLCEPQPPGWIDAAVETNRSEYDANAAPPPDLVTAGHGELVGLGASDPIAAVLRPLA